MSIERVVSPGGIEAWLVRDRTLPLIAVEFAFLGGADQDPADKPGVADMATSLLDEGAGPFDANAFHDRLERKAIEMSFRTGRDYLRGTFAHAHREPRRSLRRSAARAHRAALRPRGGRARCARRSWRGCGARR